jgi:hypothetical protein
MSRQGSASSVGFRDVLLSLNAMLAALVLIVLPSINPVADKDPIAQPGNLVASAAWPAGSTDVDMWVSASGDKPVGYKNKSGKVWSLLRDDLGTADDPTPLNYESAYTRGLPDGEYVVNVHCFSCTSKVSVSVEVRLAEGGLVFRDVVELVANKQERTAIRFRVAKGAVVAGSESRVFKKLRGEG